MLKARSLELLALDVLATVFFNVLSLSNPKNYSTTTTHHLSQVKYYQITFVTWDFLRTFAPAAAQAVNARRVGDLKDFVSQCDIVTVNCPLHEETRGLVNADLLKHFKKGAWLVNTARGAICDKDAIASALANGHLRGYSGDVWDVQPAPKDHVWRTMKTPFGGGNGMVPHYSGTTLDAQARYSAGVKAILENYLRGTDQEPQNIIVGIGKYETKACKCRFYRNSLTFKLLLSDGKR